ncbi:MAG: chemotaxis protein CheD [Phycisphaerae bacterium]|nr:chemotaxis protein CheD [Phycisphaerae bacterium]
MKIKYSDIDRFLEPGGLQVAARPMMIKTILGSCVALCLFDGKAKIGGINHYVLPYPTPSDPPSDRYGSCSIDRLFQKMADLGASLNRVRAWVVGGARPIGGERGPQVGAANREVAVQMLQQRHIRIVGEETGGENGRRVFFHTGTGEVVISVIEKNPALWTGPSRRV